MNRFSFSEYGRVYIPIDIKPKNENTMYPIRFKVDTGADATNISKHTLAGLGYDIDWIKKYGFSGSAKPHNSKSSHWYKN